MSLYDLERSDANQPVFATTDLEATYSFAQNQSTTTLATDDIYIPTLIRKGSSQRLCVFLAIDNRVPG